MGNFVEVRDSKVQGTGVFVLKEYKPGELVLMIDDSHAVTDESVLTTEQHEFDLDYVDDKIILMQAPEKFINHSCDPNVYVRTLGGVRHVLAMRDIVSGEEITYDYAVNGDNDGTFACHCGSPICRKEYVGNFFKLPIERQKYYLPYLDDWFRTKYQSRLDKLKRSDYEPVAK